MCPVSQWPSMVELGFASRWSYLAPLCYTLHITGFSCGQRVLWSPSPQNLFLQAGEGQGLLLLLPSLGENTRITGHGGPCLGRVCFGHLSPPALAPPSLALVGCYK